MMMLVKKKEDKEGHKEKETKIWYKKGDRMGACISMLRQCYFISIVSGSSLSQDNNIMKKKSWKNNKISWKNNNNDNDNDQPKSLMS